MNLLVFKNINPANFAFAMATGVVSIAFLKANWTLLFGLLLIMGLVGYLALVLLFIVRVYRFKWELLNDFRQIPKMFKYLTFSAGSNTLSVSLSLAGFEIAGLILGVIGIVSTIFLTYALFCSYFFHKKAPIQAVSPFWLLLTIACHSSGIVLTTFWMNHLLNNPGWLLLAFCFWTFGVFTYFIFMTLNLYRMIFFPFNGKDLDPCYWTCMGAAAIGVVDGCFYASLGSPPPFLTTIIPFVEGMTLFLWAWGSAWIPILCLMGIWKFYYYKIPPHYETSLWAMVFPLGMYTVALDSVGAVFHLEMLQTASAVFIWIAFASWCLVAYASRFNPLSRES